MEVSTLNCDICDESIRSRKEGLSICGSTNRKKISWRNNSIEPWKIHLLELLNEVPKAQAVVFKSKDEVVEEKKKVCGSVSSSLRTVCPSTDCTFENCEISKNKAVSWSNSQVYQTFPRIRRPSAESRIRSLRLEIGDLSIPDNLEKLCNHYFQLESPKSVEQVDGGLSDENASDSCKSWTTGALRSQSVLSEEQHYSRGGGGGKVSSHSSLSQVSSESFCFDSAFHGLLTKLETQKLLREEGHYLVRLIPNEESHILSFRFEDEILNYKVFYETDSTSSETESGCSRRVAFYLEDRKKKYESLNQLVQDGLTTLLLDSRAGYYLAMMTELAQIKKQDCLYLSPNSPFGNYQTRKNSYAPLTVSRKNSDGLDSLKRPGGSISYSRQVSSQLQNMQQDRLSKALSNISNEPEYDSAEMELSQHWFVEVKLEKKSKCRSFLCIKSTRSIKFSKRALVCKDCGMTIHEKCLGNVLSDPSEDDNRKCVPEIGKISPIFGEDLTTLVKTTLTRKEGKKCPYGPPFVLVKCIEEIEERGLLSEGLYRVSGYQDMISEIQLSFEKDKTSIDIKRFADINSICGVVKLYLRMLPEPLITTDVFDSILEENEGFATFESIKKHVKMLPAAHRITLKYLLDHLNRVSKEREHNKMSAFNLGSVLAPSMIAPREVSLNILKLGTDVVEILIKNSSSLFPQYS